MMSSRTFFVAMLALVCGVSASVGVNHLRQTAAPKKPDVIVVPVAAVAIKRGDEVTEAMLVGREWPKSLVPAGAILKKDDIVGKIAMVPLAKDEPIFSGKIGNSPRFSGLVKEGMRAYTILTPNDSSLVAGLVEPGDKVDVLYTDNTDKLLTGGASTVPLMQNIEVMAIGQIVDPSESREKTGRKMRSVTLAVPLEMASMLALAQEMGTLHLALRSEQDQATADVSAVTLTELLRTAYPALFGIQDEESGPVVPISATVAAKPNQPTQIAVRTLRGAMRSTMVMRASGMPNSSVYLDGQAGGPSSSPFPWTLPDAFPWFGNDEGSTQ
jgi:pilus assembly protein CpaB